MSSSQLTNIFQRGSNHQPVCVCSVKPFFHSNVTNSTNKFIKISTYNIVQADISVPRNVHPPHELWLGKFRGEQHLLGCAGDSRTSGGWFPGTRIQIACALVRRGEDLESTHAWGIDMEGFFFIIILSFLNVFNVCFFPRDFKGCLLEKSMIFFLLDFY